MSNGARRDARPEYVSELLIQDAGTRLPAHFSLRQSHQVVNETSHEPHEIAEVLVGPR